MSFSGPGYSSREKRKAEKGSQNPRLDSEDFVEDEGGYPASCSICLADFSADDTDPIVIVIVMVTVVIGNSNTVDGQNPA